MSPNDGRCSTRASRRGQLVPAGTTIELTVGRPPPGDDRLRRPCPTTTAATAACDDDHRPRPAGPSLGIAVGSVSPCWASRSCGWPARLLVGVRGVEGRDRHAAVADPPAAPAAPTGRAAQGQPAVPLRRLRRRAAADRGSRRGSAAPASLPRGHGDRRSGHGVSREWLSTGGDNPAEKPHRCHSDDGREPTPDIGCQRVAEEQTARAGRPGRRAAGMLLSEKIK